MRPLDPEDPREIGAYHLTGVLGRGGQGSVYLGQAPGGVKVAVKLLHARAGDGQAHRRYLREAEAARRVAPFSTARVLDVGVAADRPYLVSEYIPGPSLDALVAGEGPRTGSGLERLAVATLTALAAVHRVGIVHRDFKPGNVIMGPEGPVVIDFGIARALDHTITHSIVGTPAFMAPEQFEDGRLSPAADLFSWASTMVYAATGQHAFRGETLPSLMHAILVREPDLSRVPDGLRPILRDCLAKDPAARPTAEELLQRLLGEHPPTTRGAAVRERARPEPGWPSPPVAVTALLLSLPAALLGLVMAALAMRYVLDGQTTPELGWTRWETIRDLALAVAVPALAAALWRPALAAAIAVLGLLPCIALQLAWDLVLGGEEVMPTVLAGVFAGMLQGAVILTAGRLARRVNVVAGAMAVIAGVLMVVDTVGWAAGILHGESSAVYWSAVLASTAGARVLVAGWLITLSATLVLRAVRARTSRASTG